MKMQMTSITTINCQHFSLSAMMNGTQAGFFEGGGGLKQQY